MKVGIMQPYFFPYIGYWQLLNAVDRYVIYDDVNYIKSGWINRNRILNHNEAKMINLRMSGASSNKLINEIEVSQDFVYNRKVLKNIEQIYKNAPFFKMTFSIIERIINCEEVNLARYLEFGLREICEYLKIDTELVVSSSIEKDNNLKGQEKVIAICKLLDADAYYNAEGGRKLYAHERFASEEIELKFLKTRRIEYKQFENEFISNLSIIDVMMFNSVEEIRIMLESYELM
jgi:hypothetical protein